MRKLKSPGEETLVDKQRRLIMEKQCADIGQRIADALPAGVGFVLMTFDFGEGGHLAYISNGERADVVKVLKEWLERAGHAS